MGELELRSRELARSNLDLEQFGYAISHDLQEPLRMVTSFLSLLQNEYEGRLGPEADEYIRYATDGAVRMRAIINDLLDFSRVNSRGSSFAAVDSGQVLEAALANLHAAITESGAQISHDPLPVVAADATQLEQLFQNLIGNAVKFRGQEPPRVHVSCAPEPAGGWRFAVSDNGIGIAPQHQERIFQVFKRLHARNEYPAAPASGWRSASGLWSGTTAPSAWSRSWGRVRPFSSPCRLHPQTLKQTMQKSRGRVHSMHRERGSHEN